MVGESLFQDIRYGARALAKNRGFAAIAVLTLALGIGANTAIFSLLNAIELRRLPVRDPAQLVMLEWSANHAPNWKGWSGYSGCESDKLHAVSASCSFTWPAFDYLRSHARSVTDLAAVAGPAGVQARIHGEVIRSSAQFVSGDYFDLLGVPADLGRTFAVTDDTPGARPVAILSHRFWETRFQSDPAIVGKTIPLEGAPFTIIGVAPARFFGLQTVSLPDLWIPVHSGAALGDGWWQSTGPENGWLYVIGRLKPSATAVQARAEFEVLLRQAPGWSESFGPKIQTRATVVPIVHGLAGLRKLYGDQLHILMAVVALVLLIACANVANLLLTRASARRREIAVRLAIGCSRARLFQQLLTESALLAVCGGALGMLIGWWTSHALAVFLSTRNGHAADYRILLDARPDPAVLAFTLSVACIAALLFGLAPALSGARERTGALKSGSASFTRSRFGRALVAAEMALALILVAGAGLFVRTLVNLETLDPGFNRFGLLTFDVSRPHDPAVKTPPSINPSLRERLAALPGVRSVTWASDLLLVGNLESGKVRLEDKTELGDFNADTLRVGPQFFGTLGIPILAGRSVEITDCHPAPDVVWINRSMADKYAGQNPLGRAIFRGKTRYRIAGIVGDAKYQTLRSSIKPTVYIPSAGGGVFILRTAANPMALAAPARQAVHEVNRELLVDHVETEAAQVDEQLFTEHMMARLSAAFGLLALAMAAIGIYGVMAFSVARRTAEIAIRMALGAQPREIVRLVLKDGLTTALAGAAVGLLASWGLTKLVASLLFGVGPTDIVTHAGATLLLIGVALAACYIPARRAMKVDPVSALKYE